AVTSLEKAATARDRAAMAAPVAAIAAEVELLRGSAATALAGEVAAASLTTIVAAAEDLLRPIGDGSASDGFDLARLRTACTHCHLQNRDRNDERGLFPNRGNAAGGKLVLEERDGTVRSDRSGVVLFVEGALPRAEPEPRVPAISQKGRRFDPPVLAVTTGTVVAFPNDDVVFHNVFSVSRANPFDLGSYKKGESKERSFDKPGLVKVHCNIHPEMSAHVLVLETAWHTITEADGSWTIPDLPDGEFCLRVWHPLADEQRIPLVVSDGKIANVEVVVRETKPRAPHANKHGRPYPEKY
ncbi:MAG: hypothetical protein ABL997_18550, partial [Planctomycetota bacterium]